LPQGHSPLRTDHMRRTIQFAARRLLRAPAFATAAILTLALGIGGTTAVFTVVNGVLLRPLPYTNPSRLVDLSHSLVLAGPVGIDQSDATYLVYRAQNRAFQDIGLYRAVSVNLGALAGGAEETPPSRVAGAIVTGSVFSTLGAGALRGRVLRDDDNRPDAAPTVMISDRLWRGIFNADPSIVGKRVVVDGMERAIVGVMPTDFRFPNAGTDVWLPLPLDPTRTKSAAFDFRGIGRLKDGVSLSAATVDLKRLLPAVPVTYPGRLTVQGIEQTHMVPVVRPFRDVVVGDVGRTLWIVFGAVGVVLLIACANVANLFLARAEGRQRELAVRRALGASRASLLGDFAAEGMLVAAAGGALGLVLATAGVRYLRSLPAGESIPRLSDVRIDGLVVLVTFCGIALAALIVSVLPVLRTGPDSLSSTLMASGRSGTGRVRHRARRGLVVAQVALALVLLAAAGLLARSFASLRSVNPGFDATHALTVRMTLPVAGYPTTAFAARTVLHTMDAVSAIPGVTSVGVATKIPLDVESRQDSAVFIEGRELPPGTIPPILQIVFATPNYFRAMGISFMAGRSFAPLDPAGEPPPGVPEVIVSEAFARRYWKNESAIGKRIRMNPFDPWHVVVGVVQSVRDVALEQAPIEEVYCPLVTMSAASTPWIPRDLALVARTSGDPTALAPLVRRVVQSVDPSLPLYRVMPTSALLSEATARTTFTLLLLAIAAAVAMTIGAVGIYGVISYLVSLRTREIGIRLALGATPGDMRFFVTRQAIVDAAIGVVAGVVAAVGVTRTLGAILFNVSPTDPATLIGAAALLILTAMAASWLPARRAAALDPASTLRSD
jgi:putative ABC transport system permease protein